jgi:hypothetical protein
MGYQREYGSAGLKEVKTADGRAIRWDFLMVFGWVDWSGRVSVDCLVDMKGRQQVD